MEYWHNTITEKSFEVLKQLQKKYQFILIGGWAFFLLTKALKSKDIDVVMDYQELARLKQNLPVSKNERLKKYEAKQEEIDIDIYVPHFSDPGLPAQAIKDSTVNLAGFTMPIPEALLILKQQALHDRKDSIKGRKDIIDIFSLLSRVSLDWKKYKRILKKYQREKFIKELKTLLQETHEIKEINLTRHKIAKLKKDINI